MTLSVLAIVAHPDDIEFLCAGTLIRLQEEKNCSLTFATMTAGDCGSMEYPPEEITRLRKQEAAQSAQLLGVEYTCLEERDLRVIYDDQRVEKVVHLINKVRADIVLTHSPEDYHVDHEQTSRIVRSATFAAPIPNFLYGRHENPPVAQIPYLYYCDPLEGKDIFGREILPAFTIDISEALPMKERLLACHESQRAWLRKHHGVDNLVESMREWSRSRGALAGINYGEGFRQHLGHSYPQNNILLELLT